MKRSQRRMARPSLGGMLATRQGALVLALICAACAAGVIMFALSSYKHKAQTVTPQATVLVATGEIQKGTSGDQIASEKLYKSTPVVATQLQPGAISDASQVTGKIASTDILAGAQLTASDFTTTVGVGALLAPNQRAISIPSDQIHSDLAVLNPGDRVDLYSEFSPDRIFLLIPDVLIIKTPTSGLASAASAAQGSSATSTGSNASSPPSSAVVLAVNSSTVPDVALSADRGTLWMALRPAKATAPIGGVNTIGTMVAQAEAAAPAAPPGFGATLNTKTTTPGGHP